MDNIKYFLHGNGFVRKQRNNDDFLHKIPQYKEHIEGIHSVTDSHVHLIGGTVNDNSTWVNPAMNSIFHPLKFLQRKFLLNGAGVKYTNEETVAEKFIQKLDSYITELPFDFKMNLFAFDYSYIEDNKISKSHSHYFVDNQKIIEITKNSKSYNFVCSTHPKKHNAIQELENNIKNGAVAVKWLPSAQLIDPEDKNNTTYYETLIKHNTPIIIHAGDERTIENSKFSNLNNPQKLLFPLDMGVKVIVAHCASEGVSLDIKNNQAICNFDYLMKLMESQKYEKNLFSDISATNQITRAHYLPKILEREHLHHRLIYGSDYPLTGILPLFSNKLLADLGLINKNDCGWLNQLHQHNPVLYDVVIKSMLNYQGHKFNKTVFNNTIANLVN